MRYAAIVASVLLLAGIGGQFADTSQPVADKSQQEYAVVVSYDVPADDTSQPVVPDEISDEAQAGDRVLLVRRIGPVRRVLGAVGRLFMPRRRMQVIESVESEGPEQMVEQDDGSGLSAASPCANGVCPLVSVEPPPLPDQEEEVAEQEEEEIDESGCEDGTCAPRFFGRFRRR